MVKIVITAFSKIKKYTALYFYGGYGYNMATDAVVTEINVNARQLHTPNLNEFAIESNL